MHGHYPMVVGPDAPLPKVFAFFESDGHFDPAAAWDAFTGTWNWAAPLTTALPRSEPPQPPARPAPGGFALSGRWCPPCAGTGSWLALPLGTAPGEGPDLFVVPSRAFVGVGRSVAAGGDGAGPVFRIEDLYVPAGFVTHTTGTPLRDGDAAFLWTAVTGLALGAARRTVELLAGRHPGAGIGAPAGSATVAAELAAVLRAERLNLAATLHGAPSVRAGSAPTLQERLVADVGRAGAAVLHVISAAYGHVLTSGPADQHPVVRAVEAASPILQQVRYVTELLLGDTSATRRTSQFM
ncbi:hypothetical protein ABZZ36_30955 [Actinacidiphila glaucinigra]|uniref:hypothetical protein n=1 Tax=Actinacidiphila glaucinigra TaxID=235986 RepID=UPI0033A18F7D